MVGYIKREDAIKVVNGQSAFTMSRKKIIDQISAIPSADVVPVVHGRWIERTAADGCRYFECSNCWANDGEHAAIKGFYCWRCGAKMDGNTSYG